jgi:hypothetical protein
MRPDLTHNHRPPLHPAPSAGVAAPRPSDPQAAPPVDAAAPAVSPPVPQPSSASGGGDVPNLQAGRRSAPRLRLSLPAKLIAVEKAHTCILLNLSRTGAQVAILDAMRVGEGAILRCGLIDHFAIVTRSEFGLNALEFDEPLTDAVVLETRRYHENFEERERRALIETARKWATGVSSDDRAS